MKTERTLDLQINRVDDQKANLARHVAELPQSGREGDLVLASAAGWL